MTGVRLGLTLWAATLLGLGAFALAAGWSGPVAAIALVGAAVAPLALFAAGVRLRVPTSMMAMLVLGGSAAAAYFLVLVPNGLGVTEAVRESVPRLLTVRGPAPATAALLLPGLAVALLVGIWVALRTVGDPEDRSGHGLVAAPAGAVVLYTAGMLLTGGTADRHGVLAAAIVAAGAAGWIRLDRIARPHARAARRAPVRVVLGGPLAVALVAGVAATLVAVVPPIGAFEPRRLVDPPHRTLNEPSPLPKLVSWHENADTELFRFTATGGEAPDRLRLVSLLAYTGVAWSASATYYPIGVNGVPTLPPGSAHTASAGEFTIAGLDGLWLPGLGRPTEVTLSTVDAQVEYEADGGSLALVDATLERGLRYQVRAERDTATAEQVAAAGVPSDTAAGPLLELPRAPAEFIGYAQEVTRGARTPFEQAVALEYAVGYNRRYDPFAPVGSSYARLHSFLFEPAGSQEGAQAGSSEQFAAAFAVLARAIGLPSRVVLGFRPDGLRPDGLRTGGLRTGGGVVRGRDALAWPEIYFSGYGWYAFDPTPGTADASDQLFKRQVLALIEQQGNGPVVRPTLVPTATITVTATLPAMTARPSASSPTTPGPTNVAGAPPPSAGPRSLLPIAAGTALLLLVGALATARALRRQHHRRAGVRGAWSEVLDLLVLMGRPAPASRTATAIAVDLARAAPILPLRPAAPRRTAGPHPALVIARAAERARFAPDAPAARTTTEARPVWSALKALRRAVRAAVPLRRRLLWTIDPRPLRRRRHSSPPPR